MNGIFSVETFGKIILNNEKPRYFLSRVELNKQSFVLLLFDIIIFI